MHKDKVFRSLDELREWMDENNVEDWSLKSNIDYLYDQYEKGTNQTYVYFGKIDKLVDEVIKDEVLRNQFLNKEHKEGENFGKDKKYWLADNVGPEGFNDWMNEIVYRTAIDACFWTEKMLEQKRAGMEKSVRWAYKGETSIKGVAKLIEDLMVASGGYHSHEAVKGPENENGDPGFVQYNEQNDWAKIAEYMANLTLEEFQGFLEAGGEGANELLLQDERVHALNDVGHVLRHYGGEFTNYMNSIEI